ncbi:tRNA lysidine(34) synthetase TilS [Pseudomonas mangiferae]|uniref:tRNA(Ile)-lysidine synthase n=1 Tax=Pseudomonas mangiferae TaxID=2593654 RepID=A0A553H179_9PSED|nr:tRNA lysidine(34) synthetase TilS [Pseudomonas mangiferae]TRX75483.1 tRNA lysidine(34) synthetase TilS [Pseudomonas mangiferae]
MTLLQRLDAALAPWRQASGWCVALSGGLDSSVLLHLLARHPQRDRHPPLRALHVEHGLQAAAASWPAHCRALCATLDVPLDCVSVRVDAGASLEQAARTARYGAFEAACSQGDVLFTAHHRDDQAETLLFRLLRGAGVRGLAGMPVQRRLGQGWLVRPLLGVGRAELERHARALGLDWVDDPSNRDTHLARNHLRHDILPSLHGRWPQAAANLARSAAHLREAESLLEDLAALDVGAAEPGARWPWLGLPSLALAPLARLSPARQRNALRAWLAAFTPLPDLDHWVGWETLRDAKADATPVWRLARGELHRADGHLWWLSGDWLRPPPHPPAWPVGEASLALPGNGVLTWQGTPPPGDWTVRYRAGGEQLALPGRGHRDLKRLLNEAGVPGFARGRLPLLYCDGEPRAVANLPGLDRPAGVDAALRWTPPPGDTV